MVGILFCMRVDDSQRGEGLGNGGCGADCSGGGGGGFSSVDEILDELRAGRMVVLTDDEDRENEGDLVLPAQFATGEAIAFMLTAARGYLCLSLTESDCDRLALPPQSLVNTTLRGTPYTVSIDGHPKHGFGTGVSASERARTIRMTIDPEFGADDFVRPGHINPLRSRDGGVLVRIGQTEGSVDLCRLAGLYPAACIIEIMRDDGEMARVPDLIGFCKKYGLKMCSIRQLIEYRLGRSGVVERLEPRCGRVVRTRWGEFTLFVFRAIGDALPHLALTMGGVGVPDENGVVAESDEATLVRVHRRDLLGDVFDDVDAGSGGEVLRSSMRMIAEAGRGAVVYLRPEWSDEAWREALQRGSSDGGEDTAPRSVGPATMEYGTGSQILRALGLKNLRVISSSSAAYPLLESFGLRIVERVVPGLG